MLLSVRPHFSFTPTGSGGVDAIFNLTHFIFHLSYHIDMDKPLMFQLFNVNYSPYICHLPFSHINSLICHFHFLHIYICMWVTIWHFASYFHFSNLLLLSHLLEVECASTLTLFITMCGWQFLVFFFTRKEGRRVRLGLCALKLAQPIRLIQCDYLNILWLFFGYSSGHIIHT